MHSDRRILRDLERQVGVQRLAACGLGDILHPEFRDERAETERLGLLMCYGHPNASNKEHTEQQSVHSTPVARKYAALRSGGTSLS